jgi:hypothetical protein
MPPFVSIAGFEVPRSKSLCETRGSSECDARKTTENRNLVRIPGLAFFTAFERKHLSERVRAGHDRGRAQGKHIGRPRTTPDFKSLAKVRRFLPDRIVDLDLGHGKEQRFTSAKVPRPRRPLISRSSAHSAAVPAPNVEQGA